jgi:hypothetical protein
VDAVVWGLPEHIQRDHALLCAEWQPNMASLSFSIARAVSAIFTALSPRQFHAASSAQSRGNRLAYSP